MLLPQPLIEAEFLERLNRFSALVKVQSKQTRAYLPNSGRMKELLLKGARSYLVPAASTGQRTTSFDLLLIDSRKTLVSVDSRVPNRLLAECFKEKTLPEFERYRFIKQEIISGRSRLDFLLEKTGRLCFVEAKSVTLNKNGVARFPDAPTERGRQHLEELTRVRREGHESCVIFVAQREDSLSFSPNDETDPDFGHALRRAIGAGVKALAYRCSVTLKEIRIVGKIPVVV